MLPRQADAVEATLAENFFNFDHGRLADFRRTSMATCTGAGLCLAASPTAAAGLQSVDAQYRAEPAAGSGATGSGCPGRRVVRPGVAGSASARPGWRASRRRTLQRFR